MTKKELIINISAKTGIERAKVEVIVEALIISVKEHILKNETVSLRGLGNFVIKRRAAKVARDIGKNVAINLPAHNIPVFRPGRDFVNKVKKATK